MRIVERIQRLGAVRRRGGLLLEVVLALALVVVVGMVILSTVGQAVESVRAAREKQHAVDLARSALAKIEAGIESTTTIAGPVPVWHEEGDSDVDGGQSTDSGWELRVDSEPTGFDGLTLVSITAARAGEESGASSYTLKQLVRLAARAEDGVGAKDAVSIEAEKEAKKAESGRSPADRDGPPAKKPTTPAKPKGGGS